MRQSREKKEPESYKLLKEEKYSNRERIKYDWFAYIQKREEKNVPSWQINSAKCFIFEL